MTMNVMLQYNCNVSLKIQTTFTARSDRIILSVRPSVRPSATRVLCDEMKEHTVGILIPHERVITTLCFKNTAPFLFLV